MFRKFFTLIAVLVAPVILAGCGASIPPLASSSDRAAPVYRIATGDQLDVTVFGEEALSKEYIVTSAGDISIPLLGDMPAAGLTLAELQNSLIAKLSQGYLNDPRVTVGVVNYRPIYVLGEVQESGQFPFTPGLTATQAVALAGGYSYRARKNQIFIRRADAETELTYELNSGSSVYLAPGDTIRVGERFF